MSLRTVSNIVLAPSFFIEPLSKGFSYLFVYGFDGKIMLSAKSLLGVLLYSGLFFAISLQGVDDQQFVVPPHMEVSLSPGPAIIRFLPLENVADGVRSLRDSSISYTIYTNTVICVVASLEKGILPSYSLCLLYGVPLSRVESAQTILSKAGHVIAAHVLGIRVGYPLVFEVKSSSGGVLMPYHGSETVILTVQSP